MRESFMLRLLNTARSSSIVIITYTITTTRGSYVSLHDRDTQLVYRTVSLTSCARVNRAFRSIAIYCVRLQYRNAYDNILHNICMATTVPIIPIIYITYDIPCRKFGNHHRCLYSAHCVGYIVRI